MGLGRVTAGFVEQLKGLMPGVNVIYGVCGDEKVMRYVDGRVLRDLGEEGFLIKGEEGRVVIAGGGERGLAYGAVRALREAQIEPARLAGEMRERPQLAIRYLWSWSGVYNLPEKDGNKFFFNYHDMIRAGDCEKYYRFGEHLLGWGINGLVLSGVYGEGIIPEIDSKELTQQAYRTFCEFMEEEFGIKTLFFMTYHPYFQWGKPMPPPFCISDEGNQRFWRERVKRLYGMYPNLGGLLLAGAGGLWSAPWECKCKKCSRYSKQELLLKAIEVIAGALEEVGGVLLYKNVSDRPKLVGQEVEIFSGLSGKLPDNAFITFKTFYKDFRPPHPPNPMFYKLTGEERQPYVVEFQIFPEYRGGEHMPCYMGDRWAEIAKLAGRKRVSGFLGIFTIGEDKYDHPLNMVNWEVFGALAWNPNADVERVARDWIGRRFGKEVQDGVFAILKKSYDASMKLMFAKGIMSQNHSALPSINWELEPSFCGPWHMMKPAPPGYVGRGHDISMYPQDVQKELLADRNLLLFTRQVPLTEEFAEELKAEKREAIELFSQMLRIWQGLRKYLHEGDYLQILEGLRRNLVDAQIWYEGFALYIDYKRGRMKRAELEERLKYIEEKYGKGSGSPLTSKYFARFIEEWRALLEGHFRRRIMEEEKYVDGLPPGFAG